MLGKIVLSLLTLGTTFTVVWAGGAQRVGASDSANDPLQDTDNDMLPDCVEWAVLTNASNPDTDGDQAGVVGDL